MDRNQGTSEQQLRGGQLPVNMAEIALRSTAVLFDIQMDTARNLMQMQARSAAALGAPDCSELFRVADDRAKRLFEASTEQILISTRHANETVTEMQRQLTRLVERQTVEITEEMRQGLEELGQRAQQGLQEVKQLVRRGADETERAMGESGARARPNGQGEAEQAQPAQGQQQQAQARTAAGQQETQPEQAPAAGANPPTAERTEEKSRARRV